MNFSRQALLCALVVVSAIVGLGSAQPVVSSVVQGFNSKCSPVSCVPTGIACAKPITGCTCSLQISGTIGQRAYCEGCVFDILGTGYCTTPPVGQTFTMPCNPELLCNGIAQCGIICPCTGQRWLALDLTCGACDYAN